MTITFCLPINLVSEANNTDHWRFKANRKKKQREWVKVYMRGKVFNAERYKITFTRIYGIDKLGKKQRKYDKGDNLNVAFKAIRDEVCKHIGIDDGNDQLDFEYQQIKGDRVGVRIEIEEVADGRTV